MRRPVVLAAFAATLSAGTRASAEPSCAADGRPWVSVRLGPRVPARSQIVAQLRAGLVARGIGVCEASRAPSRPPIASIELSAAIGDRVSIVVGVSDRVTDKRVSREIDLEPLPRDAWPLSLALAADEVLRASWAELALKSAPKPKQPVPEEVKTTVRDSMHDEAAESPPRLAFGAAFVGDLYTGGQRQLGVDARAAWWFAERVFVLAGAGLRAADAVDSTHGTVRSNAFVGELGPGLSLGNPRSRFGLDALLRAEVIAIRYRAEPDSGSEGGEERGIAVYAKAGFVGFFAPESTLRLSLELLGGAPIRSVTARDTGANATGVDGFALTAALGLSGVL